jgi:MoaA/NifB/PqqE/SkfB family radical SAM enzyme
MHEPTFSSRLLRLVAANVRSKLAEQLYLATGIDATRPVQIYATLTTRCNARCLMCMLWRRKALTELPAATWVRGLRSLRRLAGSFHVQFCAAEPLLKDDLFDILAGCRAMGVSYGITTNGYLLDEATIDQLLAVRIFNVNVSIDSMDPSVHDRIRGLDGLLKTTCRNIETLLARSGGSVRVILRPTIMKDNLDSIHEVIDYAQAIGAAGVNIQPMMKWSPESEELFAVDPARLDQTLDRLIEMKRNGAPILNSIHAIRLWKDHFAGTLTQDTGGRYTAHLRSLAIDADGTMSASQITPSVIGNLATDDPACVWTSPAVRAIRRELLNTARPGVATSAERRNWRDYFRMFRRLALRG